MKNSRHSHAFLSLFLYNLGQVLVCGSLVTAIMTVLVLLMSVPVSADDNGADAIFAPLPATTAAAKLNLLAGYPLPEKRPVVVVNPET